MQRHRRSKKYIEFTWFSKKQPIEKITLNTYLCSPKSLLETSLQNHDVVSSHDKNTHLEITTYVVINLSSRSVYEIVELALDPFLHTIEELAAHFDPFTESQRQP